jgi:hypothetical protein
MAAGAVTNNGFTKICIDNRTSCSNGEQQKVGMDTVYMGRAIHYDARNKYVINV